MIRFYDTTPPPPPLSDRIAALVGWLAVAVMLVALGWYAHAELGG